MKTFMKLNVHGGVSGEVLGKIYNISKLTGKEAGHVAEEIASQAQESLKTMKVNVSMKNVMESVSKVSNRVALNFKGSGTAITMALPLFGILFIPSLAYGTPNETLWSWLALFGCLLYTLVFATILIIRGRRGVNV